MNFALDYPLVCRLVLGVEGVGDVREVIVNPVEAMCRNATSQTKCRAVSNLVAEHGHGLAFELNQSGW